MADRIAKEGVVPDVAVYFFATREDGGYLGRKGDGGKRSILSAFPGVESSTGSIPEAS
jgi:hypothetical protein